MPRIALLCGVAFVLAVPIGGCGGATSSASRAPQSGTPPEQVEEGAQRKQEATEISEDREILSGLEAKRREEAGEASAKHKEALATARAKKREQVAAKEAEHKLRLAEANVRRREAAARAEALKRREASRKPPAKKPKEQAPATSPSSAQGNTVTP